MFLPFSVFWQAGELFRASAEVMGYRGLLISKAMTGDASFADPEFARMWREKLTANLEFFRRFGRHSSSLLPTALYLQSPESIGSYMKLMNRQLRDVKACMQPYRKASGANSKRLRKNFFKKTP